MARPSKLTEKQWAEIERRALAGESVRALAKTYGVGEATIRGRGVSAQVAEIKDVAKQIVRVEESLASMSVSAQVSAHSLAAELREISTNLAGAARHGSKTAYRLSEIAALQIDKINSDDPMESQEHLQAISSLTRMSNDAASLSVGLLAANKDAMKAAPSGPSKIRLIIEGVAPNAS